MELLRYFSNSCSIRYQVIVQNVNVAITSIYVQRQAGEQTEDPFTVPAPGRNWSFLAIGIWVASLPVIPCLVMCWFWAGKDRYVVLLRTFSSSTSYTCLWGMWKSLVPATYTRVSRGWEQCRNIHSQCEVERIPGSLWVPLLTQMHSKLSGSPTAAGLTLDPHSYSTTHWLPRSQMGREIVSVYWWCHLHLSKFQLFSCDHYFWGSPPMWKFPDRDQTQATAVTTPRSLGHQNASISISFLKEKKKRQQKMKDAIWRRNPRLAQAWLVRGWSEIVQMMPSLAPQPGPSKRPTQCGRRIYSGHTSGKQIGTYIQETG